MKTQKEVVKEIRAYLKTFEEKYVFKKLSMKMAGLNAYAVFDEFGNRVSSIDNLQVFCDRVQDEGLMSIFN